MIERDYYRLQELADRWACTVHDLLHLGIQDRAQICVNIYGMATGVRRSRMETDAPEADPDNDPLTDEDRREAEAHDAAFESWKSRTTKDMPDGIFELGRDDLRFLEMPDVFPYELHEALKFDGGWWGCEFDPPVPIKLDHLCMLHEEVARIQSEMFDLFSALSATEKHVGELDDGFYSKAVFSPSGLARTAVSLIDAAMWLLGAESVEEISMRSRKERDAIGASFHKALEDVELAIAMGELKATAVVTTRARRFEEQLSEVVDPVAIAGGLQVQFNPGSHSYVSPRELKDWWAKRNAALNSDNGKAAPDTSIEPRKETTYLNIIGALLELVRTPRPGRVSDAAVIRELIENYEDKPGISKNTLETKFAEARRRLNAT